MTTASTSTQPLKLRVTRTFDAPRERVFQAWTDPTRLQKWFRPDETVTTLSTKVDLRVGGKYRLQMKHPDGEFYTAVGTYREVKAPERLVFTWQWEKDGSEADFGEVEPSQMVVTLEFHARGKQTEVVLTHENFASTESRDRHEHGWNVCLNQLARFVEAKST
jgi:uncharacterized protein YndB with AHSA1/START domain